MIYYTVEGNLLFIFKLLSVSSSSKYVIYYIVIYYNSDRDRKTLLAYLHFINLADAYIRVTYSKKDRRKALQSLITNFSRNQ